MQKGTKTGLIVAGATIAGASLVLLNSNARNKVKDTTVSVKDNVNKYAQTIKDDPQGAKEAIIHRVKNATDISKEALAKIQEVLDDQAKDVKRSAQNMKAETENVAQNVKDAKEDFKAAENKAMEAKDELRAAKDDIASESLPNGLRQADSDTITNRPVN
jgi:gas vesicle protein